MRRLLFTACASLLFVSPLLAQTLSGGVGATGANPTASSGPTAVNGSATTFLRSDAAPAINQTAAYTWTGLHTFTSGVNVGGGTDATGLSEFSVNGSITPTTAGTFQTFIVKPTINVGTVSTGVFNVGNRLTIGSGSASLANVENYISTLVFSSNFTGPMSATNAIGYEEQELVNNTTGVNSGPPGTWTRFQSDTSANADGVTSGSYINIGFAVRGDTAAAGAGGTLTDVGFKNIMSTGSSTGTTNIGYDCTGDGGVLSTNFCYHQTGQASNLFSGQTTFSGGGPFNVNRSANWAVNIADVTNNTTVTIGNTNSTLVVGSPATFQGALTYGGVALSNAVTGTGSMVLSTSPTLTTPTLGAATATTINGWTLNSATVSLTGTTGQTYTLPTTTATIARTDSAQSFSGLQTFAAITQLGTFNLNASGSSNTNIASTNNSGTVTIGNSGNTGKTVLAGLASSSAAQTGTVCIGAGNVLTFDTTTTCLLSDLRDKENLRYADTRAGDIFGLKEVLAFRPLSYDVRASANPIQHALGRQVGLGAQDVAKIDPRLVSLYQSGSRKGTPSGVRYEQMVAVLVKAVQEEQAEIIALTARIHTLESRQ